MIENWIDIPELPNYQISNFGRVKNLNRVLTQTISTTGYYYISVSKKISLKRKFKVHRLVAKAFISNPLNKKWVNHIDGNKLNNHVLNLEWSTPAENNKHAIDTGLKKMPSGENHYFSNPVIDLSTGEVFPSMKDAAKKFSINENTLRSWLGGFRKNKSTLDYYERVTSNISTTTITLSKS